MAKMTLPPGWIPDQAPANDNFDPEERFRDWAAKESKECIKTGVNCKLLETFVQEHPNALRGASIFPDGGVVIMEKGSLSTYYPRGFKIPPLRRGT
jgi:hypothetical protein